MKRFISLFCLAMLGTTLGSSASAQDEVASAHTDDAEHCVNLKFIDRTDVVDDRNILFYMRNGVVYRNALPHTCPGLEFEDAFLYRASIGRLCDLDTITVLNDAGFGFMPGASCGLGMFHPIEKEEIAALKEQGSSH
jgi:hypothetical protein